jgi:hypothetical protein
MKFKNPELRAGDFNSPCSMAIDGAGNVVVIDNCNDRIVVFSAAGVFVRAFGRRGSGTGELTLEGPCAVVVHMERSGMADPHSRWLWRKRWWMHRSLVLLVATSQSPSGD